ncbi:MAG: hypothetical protein FMNOHCHN_00943 [Ignavibacteriaceae bacterium]|nr:hypothetical protein [Ignavibacteriaceae bacterium]
MNYSSEYWPENLRDEKNLKTSSPFISTPGPALKVEKR